MEPCFAAGEERLETAVSRLSRDPRRQRCIDVVGCAAEHNGFDRGLAIGCLPWSIEMDPCVGSYRDNGPLADCSERLMREIDPVCH